MCLNNKEWKPDGKWISEQIMEGMIEAQIERSSSVVMIEITPDDEKHLLIELLQDIVCLEAERDKLGRHTNVSAHFEVLITKHQALFILNGVKKQTPRNAL
jgi:hypothetical protein